MKELFYLGKGIGRTHAMASLVKKNNGIMVCLNERHADDIKKCYGIKTVSMNLLVEKKLKGLHVPVIIDHAVYEREIWLLTEKLKTAEEKIETILKWRKKV